MTATGPNLVGGIEAGGTKFVCAIGTGPDDIRATTTFPTTTPDETIAATLDFFKSAGTSLAAIGIASFGPVQLKPNAPNFGYITNTPKPGWAHTDIVGRIQTATGLPIGFDTDVNGAAFGEQRWGAARGVDNVLYVTVGTGVGGGALVGGEPVHGLVHPEMGHVLIRREQGDPFPGICPFHGDCLEGMVSGPAIEARCGMKGHELQRDDPVWALIARYIAQAVVGFIVTLSAERIILGGGVMHQTQLFPLIRQHVRTLLNDYVDAPELASDIDGYIVAPGLGDRSGMLGAFVLAQRALVHADRSEHKVDGDG